MAVIASPVLQAVAEQGSSFSHGYGQAQHLSVSGCIH